ncbi:MAG: hypothetical protein RR246_03020 [Clostridia bacterium]
MNVNKTKIKKIALVIMVVVLVLVVILVAFLVISSLLKDKIDTTFHNSTLKFSEINYDEDILQDKIYSKTEKNIYYTENGNGQLIPEDKYETFGTAAVFFKKYFDIVSNGEYENYKNLFTPEFFKNYSIPKKFTKQKIYDINIELFSTEKIDYNGSSAILSNYYIRYKIMKNNGTFRGDIIGTTVSPLLFSIITQDNAVKINSIIKIQNK